MKTYPREALRGSGEPTGEPVTLVALVIFKSSLIFDVLFLLHRNSDALLVLIAMLLFIFLLLLGIFHLKLDGNGPTIILN